jgi:hypothetical protein
MVTRRRPVAHPAQLGRGEQLELPHETIVPQNHHDRRPGRHSIVPKWSDLATVFDGGHRTPLTVLVDRMPTDRIGVVQGVMRPDGLPVWTPAAMPGHLHDISCAREVGLAAR